MSDLKAVLGGRIRQYRKRLGLTQAELAERIGLSSHQIVSYIENGEREVRAWELAKIARVLRVEFTDLLSPEETSQEATVLWRDPPSADAAQREADFLRSCRRYRLVERLCGLDIPESLPEFHIDVADPARYKQAATIADRISTLLSLGSRPAVSLWKVLEEQQGVKIWYCDRSDGGSAASARGDFGYAILVNRSEAPWRRNFSLAHELFHLVTWEAVPPDVLRRDSELKDRVDSLADAFASNLLLPELSLLAAFEREISEGCITYGSLVQIAREFDVSTGALVYRLIGLRRLPKEKGLALIENPLFKQIDRATMADSWRYLPPMPERYVRLGFLAYQRGEISRSRLAELLDTDLRGVQDLLAEYDLYDIEGYETPIETATTSD